MKTSVAAALALALLTGTALAQQPPAPPSGGPDQQDVEQGEPPAAPAEDHPGWDRRRDGLRHPRQTKAAAFRIEAGDIRLGMKCPDDEPLKTCADFTLQLLEKLGSMQRR